jgi:lipopolysaccharide export system protein LptA
MISRRAFACLLALALGSRAPGAEPAAAAAPAHPPVPTVIESGRAEMVSTARETTFTFSQGVKITATNLTLTCDDLVVVARRGGDPAATLGKPEKFKSLLATGRVHLVQDDREATAERAEVLPDQDMVVLTGRPVVRSLKDGWVQTGPKMILHRGERRAQILGEGDVRPVLTLPPLKDLGFEKQKPRSVPQGAAAPPPGSAAPPPGSPPPVLPPPK